MGIEKIGRRSLDPRIVRVQCAPYLLALMSFVPGADPWHHALRSNQAGPRRRIWS